MSKRLGCRVVLSTVSRIFAALVIATYVRPLHADEVSMDALKARMGGVYTLEEWPGTCGAARFQGSAAS
jgi:hypothetical protein